MSDDQHLCWLTPTETAILGGGCFWCLDAVFRGLNGVISVESGYAGGAKPNPSYEEVCGGRTGHAEVVRVTFDPAVLTFRDLLTVFFTIHDPTTLNRQGNDEGTQYRSVVFCATPAQRATVEDVIRTLTAQKLIRGKIVTEVAEPRRSIRRRAITRTISSATAASRIACSWLPPRSPSSGNRSASS